MMSLRFPSFIVLIFMALPAMAGDMAGRATVLDGDTIAIEGVRHHVRLWGVDAPEGQQLCTDAHGKRFPCGSRAAMALDDLLGPNARVSCRVRYRDRFQRYIASCQARGQDIARAMVQAGWAVDAPLFSRGHFADDERTAHEARRGLWAGTFEKPWIWRKKHAAAAGHSQ